MNCHVSGQFLERYGAVHSKSIAAATNDNQPRGCLHTKGVTMRTMNGVKRKIITCLAVAYALAWAAYVVFVRGLTSREKAAMGVRD